MSLPRPANRKNLRLVEVVPASGSSFKRPLSLPLPDDSAMGFVTDPPYYDAVPYADLSDYFYVWHKRALQASGPRPFSEELTPKTDECIVDEVKGKDSAYFEAYDAARDGGGTAESSHPEDWQSSSSPTNQRRVGSICCKR